MCTAVEHTQSATNDVLLSSNCLLQRQTRLVKFETCQLHFISCFATQLPTPRLPAGQVEAQLADVQPLIDAARTAVGGIKADNINEVGRAGLGSCVPASAHTDTCTTKRPRLLRHPAAGFAESFILVLCLTVYRSCTWHQALLPNVSYLQHLSTFLRVLLSRPAGAQRAHGPKSDP
jgi:hypothetical protein